MGMLRAIQARMRAGEGVDGADGTDGYYVRTTGNEKIGPMSEAHFVALRDSADVAEISSAWRMAGGAFFKVKLTRSVVCDTSHAFSLKARNHVCEILVIVFCFCCTVA